MELDEDDDSQVFDAHMITEAITFTPTLDEFKDPLSYINKIRHIGERYGVCKIKPPVSWSPSFCIDMKAFKFTPRVQHLNELEVNSSLGKLFHSNKQIQIV